MATAWRGYASRPSRLAEASTEGEQRAALLEYEVSYLLHLARRHIGFAYQELRRHQDPRWRSLRTNGAARAERDKARIALRMARAALLAAQASPCIRVEDMAHAA